MHTAVDILKVAANGLDFEVYACGDGPRFALCLHGFPEHAISWRHQLIALAEQGYRVWAPNLRGYGNSSRPLDPGAYALPHLLADVQALQSAAGAQSMLLLGHDWGGTLAWHYSALSPERVDRLVIYNSPHPVRAQQSRFEFRQAPLWSYVAAMLVPGLPTVVEH